MAFVANAVAQFRKPVAKKKNEWAMLEHQMNKEVRVLDY